MPKDRRMNSLSSDRSRSSPYTYSSKFTEQEQSTPKFTLGLPKDVEEWADVKCPICLEHPHNAVLLQCSSYEKGCRPYMCNTSYRHSNCLDQFRKSSVPSPSTSVLQGISNAMENSHSAGEEQPLHGQTRHHENKFQHNLSCPLCRGEIFGWIVIEPARQFMNTKVRSCSCETCNFSGNYSELRKHARSVHPSVRPSEVDPERQHNWTQLEQQSEYDNLMSMIFSRGYDEEQGEDFDDHHGPQFEEESQFDDLMTMYLGSDDDDEHLEDANDEDDDIEVEVELGDRSARDIRQLTNIAISFVARVLERGLQTLGPTSLSNMGYGEEAGRATQQPNFRTNFSARMPSRISEGLPDRHNNFRPNNSFSNNGSFRWNNNNWSNGPDMAQQRRIRNIRQNNYFSRHLSDRNPRNRHLRNVPGVAQQGGNRNVRQNNYFRRNLPEGAPTNRHLPRRPPSDGRH